MTAPGRRLRLGPGSGRLLLRTRRQGLASKVGHDLTIEVIRWSALVEIGDTPEASHLAVQVDLGSLAVREGTGGALPLTDRDRAEIDGNARRILTDGKDPMATFTSTAMTRAGDGGAIDGMLRIHGVERPVRLMVRSRDPEHHRASSTVVQSWYGIKPYSAFLGALKLRDEVEVEAEVDFTAAEPA